MEIFEVLSTEAEGLYTTSRVERISPPTPLEFYREYVAQNKPVIIEGVTSNWPALKLWTNDYLRKTLMDEDVTVAVTPNGRADAVVDNYFVKPAEKKMKFGKFLDLIQAKETPAIHYIQQQNSNFTSEFESKLMQDVNFGSLKWAEDAFNTPPDAINFWMGTNDSVTSLHKDHYENIYCVIAGEKHFTLIPPIDYPYLYEQEYRTATYVENRSGNFSIEQDYPSETVPWIPVDPDYPDLGEYPLFSKAKPIKCVVKAGEVLYLPSMYYHQVSQQEDNEGRVIAINCWYDMKYGLNYAYFKFLEAAVIEKKKQGKFPKNNNFK